MKAKKCIGTHSDTKGSGCGAYAYQRTFGLCIQCLRTWAVTTEAGKIWLKKQTAYKIKSNQKEERKELAKERSLHINWSSKLQDEINAIVRSIDKGLTCLARRQGGQIHAGHVFARGGNSTIKFNLHNIHRQCAQSNKWQNDDGLLREGLILEYGNEYMDFISSLRQTPALEFNNSEYRTLTTKARKIVKRLVDEDRIYSLNERIEMRNRINIELKIYDYRYCQFNKN